MIKAKGSSWDGASDGTSDVLADVVHNTVVNYAADGAILEKTALVTLSKGSAAAMTLAAPVDGTDDGKVLTILSKTAQQHVVTSPVDGFNAKGSSGALTGGGAIGNCAVLIALAGHWYVKSLNGVTVS